MSLLGVVPAWPRGKVTALIASTVFVLTGIAALFLSAGLGAVTPMLAGAAAVALLIGTFFWERAYIRAGQLPSLS